VAVSRDAVSTLIQNSSTEQCISNWSWSARVLRLIDLLIDK